MRPYLDKHTTKFHNRHMSSKGNTTQPNCNLNKPPTTIKGFNQMTTITLQTIQSAPLSELKAFARANDIVIDGDRRKKLSHINSITDYLVESGEMEAIAQEADITIEELEASQAQLEQIAPTEKVVEPTARVTPSAATPITMLYPLAVVIIAAVMASGWLIVRLGLNIKSLVLFTIPHIDQGFTAILEGVVWLTELLWGTDFDQYSDSYLEVKHLLRN